MTRCRGQVIRLPSVVRPYFLFGQSFSKCAVRERVVTIETAQVAGSPAQGPDQPVKENPLSGLAVRVTELPCV